MGYVEYAKMNGMTPEEFQKELFTIAACAGMSMIESSECDGNAMVFTCSDEHGEIELTVSRKSG